ncbi:MAG: O-antigen ligase family protein [Bacteroidetes bacterium]|nr:O-antigen ligase family protein [Bacteroidota bacterium]
MMVTSITMLIYFLVRTSAIRYKLMLFIPIVWLLYFIILIESLTGVLVLLVSVAVIPIYFIIRDKNRVRKFISFLILMLIPVGCTYLIISEINQWNYKYDIIWNKLDRNTLNGNAYFHNREMNMFENDHFVGSYICLEELDEAWNMRSERDITGKSNDGFDIRPVLIRYMTSKGLRKDSLGISKLSEQDIANVENGVTNYLYPNKRGIAYRLYGVKWQFQIYLNGGNPSGHSLTQRFEYWRNAYRLFRSNLWFGVGVGDAEAAIVNQYEVDKSVMNGKWRLLAHNQFLTIGIQVGLVGLIAVIYCFYLLLRTGLQKKAFLFSFFIIGILVSMLFEDTLVTQTGCTLFGCIGSFLLLSTDEPV